VIVLIGIVLVIAFAVADVVPLRAGVSDGERPAAHLARSASDESALAYMKVAFTYESWNHVRAG
jgi:hypothetical protein